ncbi:protein of unknown function [Bradyrhizobium vignae]|uniref:Uncharacterized protein n=1 Tax=Bradyrhizobium vignae TaxID=1549949 RepID=A0A2U3PXQ7_9BRAD|nr:protein of unknown function [Bradyrhizobium vignae]
MLQARKETSDIIDCPLVRLQAAISRFVAPSAASTDIQALKLQIQLRRLALRDIAVISSRLQRADGRISRGLSAKKGGLARRSCSPGARRGRRLSRLVQ